MSIRSNHSPFAETTIASSASGSSGSGRINELKKLNAKRAHWSEKFSRGLPKGAIAFTPESNSLPPSVEKQRYSDARSRSMADFTRAMLMERYGKSAGSALSKKSLRAKSATNLQAASEDQRIRDREDILHEVMKLKRQMLAVNNENSMLKTKVRKLETELTKKEKELDELLDPMRISKALTLPTGMQQRILTQTLKQKIVRLEQAVRAKDTALNSLKSDLKTTQIEELKAEAETMYHEILRLRQIQSTSPEMPLKNRIRTMQETINRFSDSNQKLLEENKNLQAKLNEEFRTNRFSENGYISGKNSGKSASNKIEGHIEKFSLENLDKEKFHVELEKKEQEISHLKHQLEKLARDSKLRRPHSDNDNDYFIDQKSRLINKNSIASSSSLSVKQKSNKETSSEKPITQSRNSAKVEQFRRNKAAKTIQKEWRNFKEHEAISTIKSAIQGHVNRLRILSNQQKFPADKKGVGRNVKSDTDSISMIVDAVRGHMIRTKSSRNHSVETDSRSEDTRDVSHENPRTKLSQKYPTSVTNNDNGSKNTYNDDENDSFYG